MGSLLAEHPLAATELQVAQVVWLIFIRNTARRDKIHPINMSLDTCVTIEPTR